MRAMNPATPTALFCPVNRAWPCSIEITIAAISPAAKAAHPRTDEGPMEGFMRRSQPSDADASLGPMREKPRLNVSDRLRGRGESPAVVFEQVVQVVEHAVVVAPCGVALAHQTLECGVYE